MNQASALKASADLEWARIEAARAALQKEREAAASERQRLDDEAAAARNAQRAVIERECKAWNDEKLRIARTFVRRQPGPIEKTHGNF